MCQPVSAGDANVKPTHTHTHTHTHAHARTPFDPSIFDQHPTNDYLLMHSDSSWDVLDLLWNKVPEEHTKVSHLPKHGL